MNTHSRLTIAFITSGALLLGACSSSGSSATPAAGVTPGATPPASAVASPAASAVAGVGSRGAAPNLPSLNPVVAQVLPSAVQVTSQQAVATRDGQSATVPAGVGTGVIYDNDGHILTNNHVVEGAQGLLVALPDGRSFTAKLVGADPQTDLAVLQISGDKLPVAKLGNSDEAKPGDWVVAVGNALGLPGSPTVSAGVVSAVGRTVQEPGSGNAPGPFLFGLLQTDAAINPGNSGGPLANLQGEVIGLNTLVAGQAEPGVPAQGIGFAISINTAKAIAAQLVKDGKADHAYLGVSYVPLSPATAVRLGVKDEHGAIVGQVADGSPAAAAGLKANDVITAVDGKDLKGESDLAAMLSAHKPGDQVKLTVSRGGAAQEITATLGTAPRTS